MTLEQDSRPMPDHEQELEAHGYRPSVRLAQHDELRLLDEALEEAKARPRPPRATYAAPPVPLRPRAIAAAVNPPPTQRQVEDQRANGHRIAGPEVGPGAADGEQEPYLDPPDEAADVNRRPAARRQRIDIADILAFSSSGPEVDPDEPDGGGTVDRKRLLAAIICILQEELTRSK